MRTRATQALDRLGVAYDLLEFEAEEHTAEEAVRRLGLPPEVLFKTLVVRADDGRVFLACVPADRELDLRALARAAGARRVELVAAAELMRLVGYVKGGVSPLATRRRLATFVDASALRHPRISISAGARGLQIWIAPDDLVRATGARVATIA
ncbi:MAG: YbaK/EbsC family protein [Armatimonadota bacterium]|nr:YbaK/EbsC family protein [Armatimonadota bacterium]MDR7423015.1 YbaK/EbsC family protein [Armatimonadota bacterium]MDR7453006.1 YbaK/EbsC family protein [Armatimonadota bacterium]MDR7458038.1 YbaK/EbsC family protein [Armatimonadota bacterium]MDR7496341.1 YbaK/EbsC family protein [Armatimonadota bacterium]